jgi:hypothetical protein
MSVRLEPAFQPLAPVIGLNHETPGKRWKSVSAVWAVPLPLVTNRRKREPRD